MNTHQRERERERVLENDNAKILWNFSGQTGHKLELNKQDINLDLEIRECHIIDTACPFGSRGKEKYKSK